MDRTGVTSKRGKCQLSFVYKGERFRVVLPGLQFDRPSDRKAAERILSAAKRDIDLQTFYFPKHFPDHPAAVKLRKGHQITVEEELKSWLLVQKQKVEPTTYYAYEKCVNYHHIPTFGKRRLSDLLTTEVEDYLHGLDVCGKTKNNILIPLRAIYKKALRDEKIERDPIAKIGFFPHRATPPDPLSSEEIKAVLAASEGQIRNIIAFGIMTGLRTSELIAVRWEDVDFGAALVHVRITRTNQGEKRRGKTTTSLRSVHLAKPALDALTAQLAFTNGKTSVFENPRTGEPWKSDNPYRKIAWYSTVKKSGIRHRPGYQTRHTYASMLLSYGADPMYVAQQMGHRDWGMIRKVYGRWMPERSGGQQTIAAGVWAPLGHQDNAAN